MGLWTSHYISSPGVVAVLWSRSLSFALFAVGRWSTLSRLSCVFLPFNILSTNRERSSDAEPTPSGLCVGGIRGQWFWIETQPTVSMWVKCNLNPTQFAGLTLNNRSSSSSSSSTGPGSTLTGPGCQNPLKFNLNPFSSASGNLQQHSLLFKIPLGSEVFSELLKKWLKRWKVTKNQMNRTECESRSREEMLLQFMLSLLMTTYIKQTFNISSDFHIQSFWLIAG